MTSTPSEERLAERNPEERVDVLIVGAGLAGCATAQALALADPAAQRRIVVIDRHRRVHPRFSGEFIHPRGAQILDDLGFYEPLRQAGAVDADGFIVYENADERRVDLPYSGVPYQRPRGLSVHHKVLVPVMRQVVSRQPQVDLREGWTLERLIRDPEGVFVGAELSDADGRRHRIRCDLTVGADGKGSAVRRMAGIGDGRETIGFTAGVEVVDAALPGPNSAHVLLGAWGPILAYPVLRDRQGTTRVRVTFDLPRELPVKGPALSEHLLRTYVPHMPAPLSAQTARAIEATRGRLEMAPTVNLPAPTATLPGLALVGDAAGCSHPITASGMTMGLRDAETLGLEAARRARVPAGESWLGTAALRRYRADHDRYVPTRQALADAIYEAFRGDREGKRAIRRALFDYWESGPRARERSMALLSCAEGRPSVFLTEYLKTARHAVGSSLLPRHAPNFPVQDRLRQVRGAVDMARGKLGMVANVMWAQVRPTWLGRP